jgi:hypothetical protein
MYIFRRKHSMLKKYNAVNNKEKHENLDIPIENYRIQKSPQKAISPLKNSKNFTGKNFPQKSPQKSVKIDENNENKNNGNSVDELSMLINQLNDISR